MRRLNILMALLLLAAVTPARAADPVPLPPLPANPLLPAVVVTAKPSPAKTATFVDIQVDVYNTGAGDSHAFIDFGDGNVQLARMQFRGCNPVTPTGHDTASYRHAYRYPGTYTIRYTVHEGCLGSELYTTTGTAAVTVTAGPMPSNGPWQPRFEYIEHNGTRKDGATILLASPLDYDGYMTGVVYSWGDRSANTVFTFPLSKCIDRPNYWPRTGGDPKATPPHEAPAHKYARKGTYTVTATMTTTGCDGKHPQTARGTTKITAK